MFCASKVEGSSKVEGVFTITDVYVQLQTLLVFRAILEGGGVAPQHGRQNRRRRARHVFVNTQVTGNSSLTLLADEQVMSYFDQRYHCQIIRERTSALR